VSIGSDVESSEGPHRRLTRAESKARTREQLLDAAADVFGRRGFDGATVEEIAETAGYSTGALYSNFANKEELFVELLSARRTRGTSRRVSLLAGILEADAAHRDDPLRGLTEFFVRFADRDAGALEAEFWLYAVRHPEAMGIIAERQREQVDALELLIERTLRRIGADPGVPVRDVTIAVVGLFQGLVRRRRVDASAVPDELFAQAMGWIFTGLRRSAGGRSASAPAPPETAAQASTRR
jgi:AcrR family transcriptional regulator